MATEDPHIIREQRIMLDIVTPEVSIFSGRVKSVTAPGVEGELGILPHHAPLITILKAGEIRIDREDEEIRIAVGGGFLEVTSEHIIVLADIAERDDQIDAQKAEEAKHQAEESLSAGKMSKSEKDRLEAALHFELTLLNIAAKRKKKDKKMF